jgi:hypothetical protein
VTGGGFHEFVKQETILPPAIAQRIKIDWTIDHTAGTSTEVLIERHKNTDWTKSFDVVLYNMSFSYVVDVPWIERLAGAHRDSGVGAVILHGAVHSYRRSESRAWGELMGAFSLRHDSQRPLTVEAVAPQHPIMRGLPPKWQTSSEELYVLERVWPSMTPLAEALQRRVEEELSAHLDEHAWQGQGVRHVAGAQHRDHRQPCLPRSRDQRPLVDGRQAAGRRHPGARVRALTATSVDDRTVVGVVLRQIRPRLSNHRFQFVLVDGDPQPGIGRQLAMSVLDGRQRFRQEVGVLGVAALLDHEVGNRRGDLQARRK